MHCSNTVHFFYFTPMKVEEVPQEGMEYRNRDHARKLMYAVDKDGSYTGVNSAGWEPENLALRQAWENIEDRLLETKKEVDTGVKSPIAYHMERCLMDTNLLASYMGIWKWRVKRHMQPSIFKKLKDATLGKYASIFQITTDELKNWKNG